MALFVDGPACTIEDLTAHDAGLLRTAQSEGIDVSVKIGLAMEELTAEIQLWLNKPRWAVNPLWQPVMTIDQIAVTLGIRRWCAMQTLALVYRDAYFSQLVDRYQKKWDEYARLTRDAREAFVASGLAIVMDPVRRAGIPVLGSVPASQAGGVFYSAVSYLNLQGKEGAASEVASVTLSDGNAMTVTAADATAAWNVYAGSTLDALLLQNAQPLAAGATWTYTTGASVPPGVRPPKGQLPDLTMPLVRTWTRG